MEICTIILDNYDLKFTKDGDYLTITASNDGCTININDRHPLWNDPFSERLLHKGWSLKGIGCLQEYLCEECLWDACIKMDPKTGVIKRL